MGGMMNMTSMTGGIGVIGKASKAGIDGCSDNCSRQLEEPYCPTRDGLVSNQTTHLTPMLSFFDKIPGSFLFESFQDLKATCLKSRLVETVPQLLAASAGRPLKVWFVSCKIMKQLHC